MAKKPMKVDYKPASRIVRAVANKVGKYGATVYNDRLRDGSRSFKIWGAGKKTYLPIARKLESMGYTVTFRNIGRGWAVNGADRYRIHVR